MPTMKESYDEDEDGYDLTYYESKRGTQNRIVNIEGQTSLPYFGMKLSCVCLMFSYKKTAYSYPKVTYSYPKVT